MSVKKTLVGIASYALVGAVAFGIAGTLAHQTDSTTPALNVQTVGDISIKQNEQERVNDNDNQTELQEFTQDKLFMPAFYDGSSIPWASASEWIEPDNAVWKVVEDNPNVLDKIVTVTNTGTLPAYVRTIVAVEVGTGGVANNFIHPVVNDGDSKDLNNQKVLDGKMSKWKWVDEEVEIGDGTYAIGYVTYLEPVQPNETTVPSLKQVYLGKEVTEEIVESFGSTYDILVMSQAVQVGTVDVVDADGKITKSAAEVALDTAFYELSETNHPWAERDVFESDTTWYTSDKDASVFTIDSADELIGLAKIVNSGEDTFAGDTITLDANISLAGYDWEPIGQPADGWAKTFMGTFDGAGYTISNVTVENEEYAGLFGKVKGTIKNLTVTDANIITEHYAGGIVGHIYGNVYNCTVKNSTIYCVEPVENPENGDKAGAIVGWLGESSYTISGCKAENVTITANRDAGQIVGLAWKSKGPSTVEYNTAINVTVEHSGYGTGDNIKNDPVGRWN